MAIYLLHGDSNSTDPFKIKARLDELLKGIPREGNLNFATFDLSTSGTSFHDVVSSALTVPFLGGSRTVVARSLKAFEKRFFQMHDKKDEGESKDEAEDDVSGSAEEIIRSVEQLASLPDNALLILVEENDHLDGRTRFYKALTKVGCQVESFKAMWFDPASGRDDDIRSVVEFVQEHASRLGLRLSKQLAEKVAIRVGADSGTIVKELEKLVLYVGKGAQATPEDLEAVITRSYEAGIFQLVDLVGQGQTGKAIEALTDLMDHGAAAPYILAMLARQIRLIARVREANARGVPYNATAGVLKESPFVIRKIQEQVRIFPEFSYPAILEHLMEADVHLKRGTMPPKLALETLITRIAARGGSEGDRHRSLPP